MGDALDRATLFEAIAATGKALAHGRRLELLGLLIQSERRVDALARAAGLGVTTVSAHLQTLKQAGLVVTRRDGTSIYYRVAGDDVAALYERLLHVARRHQVAARQARRAHLGPEDTAELTREEVVNRVRAGTATVVDVRPPEEYLAGHIRGAVSLPSAELDGRWPDLPAGADLVVYGREADCALAHDAARQLSRRGHRAARSAAGMLEWRLAGLPVVPGHSA